MSVLLSVEHLSSGYGRQATVQEISLSVPQGEFCALLGLNGSGKTTMLRTICGFVPIQTGRCLIGETDCVRLNERQRARLISYIPQRGSLITGKSVMEVVLMGFNPRLSLLDTPGKHHRKLAMQVLENLNLAGLAQRDYATLSEGQKQLVILARTVVQDTPVMLMDEPDSALDFSNRHMVLNVIRTIVHQRQCTGLITLHDPNFALAYCDRLLLMRNGVLIGNLAMEKATQLQLETALSEIYGDIHLLPYKQTFVMVRR